MALQIIKAKPNPVGKDKVGNIIPQLQLAGEWVDFKNVSGVPIDLINVELYHWAYKSPKAEWEIVLDFSGTLPAGEIVRVHSGGKIPESNLRPEDYQGADHHVFSGKNYTWNNDKKDYPRLWNKSTKKWIDSTYYEAWPPEGKVLVRRGDKLEWP